MRIVIFGTGLFYERRKQNIPKEVQIVAFLDNDINKKGKCLDGSIIIQPNAITDLQYDVIVLASTVPKEMKAQMLSLNVPRAKILYWEEFLSVVSKGVLTKYGQGINDDNPNKFLAIVPIINFAGGFMTAFYTSQIMKNKGFEVVIASPVINEAVVEVVIEKGIDVWHCPSLPYIDDVELSWINQFEYVLCNSLQTILCASRIRKGKNVLFWIHEHSGQFENILDQYLDLCSINNLNKIQVFAVSSLGKQIVQMHMPYIENIGVLPFGIPDQTSLRKVYEKDKITLVQIGSIAPLKNQMALVEAIENLDKVTQKKIECKIIGKDLNKNYRIALEKQVENIDCISVHGEMCHDDVQKEMANADIVVCTSVEETMSMVVIEGMMNSKVCITNDNTGVAEFIENGVNGFVYKEGNQACLNKLLANVISDYENSGELRKMARKTYEELFSKDNFTSRISSLLGI